MLQPIPPPPNPSADFSLIHAKLVSASAKGEISALFCIVQWPRYIWWIVGYSSKLRSFSLSFIICPNYCKRKCSWMRFALFLHDTEFAFSLWRQKDISLDICLTPTLNSLFYLICISVCFFYIFPYGFYSFCSLNNKILLIFNYLCFQFKLTQRAFVILHFCADYFQSLQRY